MQKSIEIGKNYGGVFGLDASKSQTAIYNGNDSWTMSNGEKSITKVSIDTTKKVLAYINQPSYKVGV